jgi:TonB-dependent SusC/RagA subfamily outer membrane receptor
MKHYLVGFYLLWVIPVIYAQERNIQGKVSTFENISVAKASIKVKSTNQVVLSDSAGLFSVQCNKKDKLKIYAHGFYNVNVKVSQNTKFVLANIKLKPGLKNQDYAIGYGHVSDAKRLNAIATVERDNTNFSRYYSMIDLIQGQFPGVQVQGNEIIIRNSTTKNSGAGALIILDGRKIDVSQMIELNTRDVKSINLLKDGSASMYGVQGGNGVVVIMTRRGGE